MPSSLGDGLATSQWLSSFSHDEPGPDDDTSMLLPMDERAGAITSWPRQLQEGFPRFDEILSALRLAVARSLSVQPDSVRLQAAVGAALVNVSVALPAENAGGTDAIMASVGDGNGTAFVANVQQHLTDAGLPAAITLEAAPVVVSVSSSEGQLVQAEPSSLAVIGTDTSTSTSRQLILSMELSIGVGIVASAAVLLLAASARCAHKRRRRRRLLASRRREAGVVATPDAEQPQACATTARSSTRRISRAGSEAQWEWPASRIKWGRRLGNGSFGSVHVVHSAGVKMAVGRPRFNLMRWQSIHPDSINVRGVSNR